eukprot:7106622-Pyramimonas_sp.AAC.1
MGSDGSYGDSNCGSTSHSERVPLRSGRFCKYPKGAWSHEIIKCSAPQILFEGAGCPHIISPSNKGKQFLSAKLVDREMHATIPSKPSGHIYLCQQRGDTLF